MGFNSVLKGLMKQSLTVTFQQANTTHWYQDVILPSFTHTVW